VVRRQGHLGGPLRLQIVQRTFPIAHVTEFQGLLELHEHANRSPANKAALLVVLSGSAPDSISQHAVWAGCQNSVPPLSRSHIPNATPTAPKTG